MKKGIKQAGIATLAVFASAGVAQAADGPSVEELDQRIKVLERQLELQAEDAATKAKDATTATASDKGFSLKKGDYELKIKALVQADANFFTGDDATLSTADTFRFRRIRPTFEGSLGKLVGFRLTPEFAGNGSGEATSIIDAYIDLKFDPAYTLRAGKVKGPVGLERLQSGSALTFIERGYPTQLVPNRDLGIQLQGDVLGNTLNYTIGWYNGVTDAGQVTTRDGDNRKEFAGRLFAEPFKNQPGFLQGLGFGIGASTGEKRTTAGRPGALQSIGTQTIFQYGTTVAPDGTHTRIAPQAYFYRNNFGLLAEYTESKQELRNTPAAPGVVSNQEFTNTAWQVVTSYVLTGEDSTFRGVTKPQNAFTIGGPGWGAFEVAARYGELDLDDDIFTTGFASAATNVSEAKGYGVGVNWYLNSNLKISADYNQSSFEGGAAAGADRKDEKAIFSRIQLSF